MRRLLIALALATALLIAPGHATASPHDRGCGLTPRVDGERFQVKIEQGHVRCATAKRVATRFLRTHRMRPVRHWMCFRGHGSEPAASCSRGPGVVVRVYAPG
jgi:hypothetical protein